MDMMLTGVFWTPWSKSFPDMAKTTLKTRPWCPFCGQDVARPQYPDKRHLGEFALGSCECGAVYASDPTGFNIGAAIVECLVHACGDNWDLAWDLLPEQDYLTGRIEDYDETTHQVVESRNLDGRIIRGVRYRKNCRACLRYEG